MRKIQTSLKLSLTLLAFAAWAGCGPTNGGNAPAAGSAPTADANGNLSSDGTDGGGGGSGGNPDQNPSQSPAPSPSATPEASPSPAPEPKTSPSPGESPSPAPEPKTSPSPGESPSPAPEPKTSPSPGESPSPVPEPKQSPTPPTGQEPGPTPEQSPSPTPTTSPTASPTAAPTASPSPTASPTPGAPTTVTVQATDELQFNPATITIRVGDTVTWQNSSSLVHTVTDDPSLAQDPADAVLPPGADAFDSGDLAPGESYTKTFTVPGEYHYFCRPHEAAGMLGVVIVR